MFGILWTWKTFISAHFILHFGAVKISYNFVVLAKHTGYLQRKAQNSKRKSQIGYQGFTWNIIHCPIFGEYYVSASVVWFVTISCGRYLALISLLSLPLKPSIWQKKHLKIIWNASEWWIKPFSMFKLEISLEWRLNLSWLNTAIWKKSYSRVIEMVNSYSFLMGFSIFQRKTLCFRSLHNIDLKVPPEKKQTNWRKLQGSRSKTFFFSFTSLIWD